MYVYTTSPVPDDFQFFIGIGIITLSGVARMLVGVIPSRIIKIHIQFGIAVTLLLLGIAQVAYGIINRDNFKPNERVVVRLLPKEEVVERVFREGKRNVTRNSGLLYYETPDGIVTFYRQNGVIYSEYAYLYRNPTEKQ